MKGGQEVGNLTTKKVFFKMIDSNRIEFRVKAGSYLPNNFFIFA